MSVNSISPGQPVRTTETPKKTEAAAARKQSYVQEADKEQARKIAAEYQPKIQRAAEPGQATVNSSGQKIGSHINTSA